MSSLGYLPVLVKRRSSTRSRGEKHKQRQHLLGRQATVLQKNTEEEAPSFDKLSQKQQKPFLLQHQREEEAYKDAQKVRQEAEKAFREKLGEVLLCTAGGSVLRLLVQHVDVLKRSQQGRCLMKVPRQDTLISASLLSTVDQERDAVVADHSEELQDAPQDMAEEAEEEEEDDEEE
mmetsp:Transcript_47962/g.89815  ORF Transcript_47962/g.89815 Transcript_47962/m.89815 type:complete len:176 (+) Transcript_47962:399-926(+)